MTQGWFPSGFGNTAAGTAASGAGGQADPNATWTYGTPFPAPGSVVRGVTRAPFDQPDPGPGDKGPWGSGGWGSPPLPPPTEGVVTNDTRNPYTTGERLPGVGTLTGANFPVGGAYTTRPNPNAPAPGGGGGSGNPGEDVSKQQHYDWFQNYGWGNFSPQAQDQSNYFNSLGQWQMGQQAPQLGRTSIDWSGFGPPGGGYGSQPMGGGGQPPPMLPPSMGGPSAPGQPQPPPQPSGPGANPGVDRTGPTSPGGPGSFSQGNVSFSDPTGGGPIRRPSPGGAGGFSDYGGGFGGGGGSATFDPSVGTENPGVRAAIAANYFNQGGPSNPGASPPPAGGGGGGGGGGMSPMARTATDDTSQAPINAMAAKRAAATSGTFSQVPGNQIVAPTSQGDTSQAPINAMAAKRAAATSGTWQQVPGNQIVAPTSQPGGGGGPPMGPGGIPAIGQFANPVFQQGQQARGMQMGYLNRLQGDMSGQAPSLAQAQLAAGMTQGINAQASGAAGAGGAGYGLAARTAAMNAANMESQAGNQAAQLRAQEYASARDAYGAGVGAMRGADITSAGQSYQNALQEAQFAQQQNQSQADLETKQRTLNYMGSQGYFSLGMHPEDADLNSRMHYMDLMANKYGIDKGASDAAYQADRANQNQWLGTGLEAVGTTIGLIGLMSDERVKEDIAPADDRAISEFLGELKPRTFRYKNPNHGQGENLGIMAQDALKTKLGRLLVMETPDGLALGMKKTVSALLATGAHHEKRLRSLEANGRRPMGRAA